MNEDLRINQEHLKLLIRLHSTSTVGEVMKRFETIEDKVILKSQVKELLYEKMRDFQTLIIAYGLGKEKLGLDFIKDK